MPHQKPIPVHKQKPSFRNAFNSESHYPYTLQPPHYSPNLQNDYFRRADEAHHYAHNYYEKECNNDESWRPFRTPQQIQQTVTMDDIKNVKKVSSHESDEEAAATALLISAGGPRRVDVEKLKEREAGLQASASGMDGAVHEGNQACHVSVNSMDGQENGSLISSSNVDETASECLQKGKSNGNLPTFPATLHDVLTDSEFSGSVLEWLPNGKSWRVLRWDDLANKVVPVHFPEIESKDGKEQKATTSDRINKFLQHLKVWGFEEMKEVGPEMGTYKHEFFIRIAPNLCRHMKTNKTDDAMSFNSVEPSPNKPNSVTSPTRSAPMVPLMAPVNVVQNTYLDSPINSRPIGHCMVGVVSVSPKKRKTNPEMMGRDNKPSPLGRTNNRFVSYPDQDGSQPSAQSKPNIPYRPGSPSYPYNNRRLQHGRHPNFVSPSQSQGLSLFVGSHKDRSDNRSVQIPDSPYQSSFKIVSSRPQRKGPSTPRLQSNRGGGRACRLDRRDEIDKRSGQPQSPGNTDKRRSFPVSNRGKGRRAHIVRTLPPHPIQDSDLPVRNCVEILRSSADCSTMNTSDTGKDNIEEITIADRDDGNQLKRRRHDSMKANEVEMLI